MTERVRGSIVDRDQGLTPFGAILLRLCDNTGALGAALVDQEGETVDYAGSLSAFEMRVAAAEWRLVMRFVTASRVPSWTETREIVVRAKHRSFGVVQLPDGYAIVLELGVRCFRFSPRATSEAVRDLCREAGLELPEGRKERWSRVDVRPEPGNKRRPAAVWVGSAWCELVLLGRYSLENGEVGYRARLPSGAEINLVREQLGRWYAEDLPQY